MSVFNEIREMVEGGMDGRNPGIPIGFPRLNDHINIRKSMGYLIGGYTGSGKTSLLDDAFVLNPIEWLMKHPEAGIDLHVIYFSMERKKSFKMAKWVARRMFLDHGGIPIGVNRLMGWVSPDKRLSRDEFRLFSQYEEYINQLMSRVTIIEGPQNPMGIKKIVDNYALENGRKEKVGDSQYDTIYIPKDPNKITLIIYDHIGLQKKETREGIKIATKKEIIDQSSEDARKFRDFYGFSYVKVSQFNRDISNPIRIKNGDVGPMLEDFKDSGSTQEDADAVLALFDPYRYMVEGQHTDKLGYEVNKMRDEYGRKKYRSIAILKNSYGSDDITIGLGFQPEIGHFKELPRLAQINDEIYQSIKDNTYFLT